MSAPQSFSAMENYLAFRLMPKHYYYIKMLSTLPREQEILFDSNLFFSYFPWQFIVVFVALINNKNINVEISIF